MSTSVTSSSAAGLNPDFKNAVRLQRSVLAPIERRCLDSLVRVLPSWLKPDHLTALGFAAMLAAGVSYGAAGQWPAALLVVNVMLAVNWFGDSLDGTLARARNKLRPRYGFYVDHIVDSLGILAVLCGLAASGYMSWTIALATLVVYFLLSIDVYLAAYTIGTFRMSFFKLGPTELRTLLAIANVRAFLRPTVSIMGERYLFFDVAAVVAIAVMTVMVTSSVVRNTVLLYRAERV